MINQTPISLEINIICSLFARGGHSNFLYGKTRKNKENKKEGKRGKLRKNCAENLSVYPWHYCNLNKCTLYHV